MSEASCSRPNAPSADASHGVELSAKSAMAPAPASYDRKIVLLLCLVAAAHVFVFSAGFPFFNNVDEPAHFDLVVKYSHGHVPRGAEKFSPDAAAFLALFSSCAFMGTPDDFPDHRMPPPPWTQAPEKMRRDFAMNSAAWQLQTNYEVSQTPLYYALAGLWWRGGQCLGLQGGGLLYSLRFFNIIWAGILVWLTWLAARLVFPRSLFLQIAPPILVALMPQSAFYSIGNDVLSPVFFGVTFILLLKWLSADRPTAGTGAATGLAFAATWLAKATNLPVLAVAGLAALFKTWQIFRKEGWRALVPFLTFLGAALPPMIVWAVWCKLNYGDFSGSVLKMRHFGWTIKPFGQWWHHPIFSPEGIWTYLNGQLDTFWQGELLWRNEPMALHGSASIYTALSLILIIMSIPFLWRNPVAEQRRALQLSLVSFIAALGFFALMSIVYDFHNCPNPSREHPYFQAGRMILGALIPFMLLIAYGIDRALNRFGLGTKFIVLGILVSLMLASEIVADWPAFSSPYNWFHLP